MTRAEQIAADLAALRRLFRLAVDGDTWGTALGLHFAAAEALDLRGYRVPPTWDYRPSPLGRALRLEAQRDHWPDSEIAALRPHPEALRLLGDRMARLVRRAAARGENY